MKHLAILMASLFVLVFAADADAQLLPEPFRYDLASFFSGANGRTWIGEARMFNSHYTDTVHVRYDPKEGALLIRRILVDESDSTLVSHGVGLITLGTDDSVHSVRWTEKNYPEAAGRMYWDPEYSQWRVNFDGRWKQWFIHIRRVSENAFEAAVARQVASFPAVELLNATYRVNDD
ncbi:MAG: hypothetical protein Kow0074_07190 [Candidatus Zixiibacteriota bacterium]